jgi:hypothetical protein
MKKTTLDVVQTANERLLTDDTVLDENSEAAEGDTTSADTDASTTAGGNDAKTVVVLTQDDPCVHEYCTYFFFLLASHLNNCATGRSLIEIVFLGAALENCLKLGLKPQSNQDISLWNVLYSSSLVVDEPDLVQSIQTAALLSDVCLLTCLVLECLVR